MYKKISVITVLCFLLVGCFASEKPKKPDNLISKDKMALLIYDLHVINAAKGVNRKVLEVIGFVPDQFILNKYNVDSLQFSESNAYYTFDSETYNDIVEKVKTRLEKDKDSYSKILEEEAKLKKKIRDSIQEANKKRNDSIKTAAKAVLKAN